MRKKQVPQEAILPLEQRIRVADFLLLLITIDKRLSLEAKAKKASKAADKTTKNDVDTGSRSLRAFFVIIEHMLSCFIFKNLFQPFHLHDNLFDT